ncbi:D(1) dopamine receptor-like [Glandiceps talaboti]
MDSISEPESEPISPGQGEDDIFGDPELAAVNATSDTLQLRIPIGTLLLVIILFTLIGNILIFYAVFTFKRLRTPSNLVITSLAFSDLLTGAIVMPFRAITDLSGHWYFGPIFCDLWVSIDILCSIASVLNIILITIDRCLAIKSPFRYKFLMSKTRVCAAIVILWVTAFVFAFTPVYAGWNNLANDQTNFIQTDHITLCFLRLSSDAALCYAVLSFMVPNALALIVYCQVIRATRLRSVRIHIVVEPAARIPGSADRESEGGRNNREGTFPASNKSIEARACKKLGIILGAFLLCWTPFFIIQSVRSYCVSCISPTIFKMVCWFAACDAAIIPMLYIKLNSGFRRVFYSFLSRFCFCLKDIDVFDDNSNSLTNNSQNMSSNRSTLISDVLDSTSTPQTPRTALRQLTLSSPLP